MPGKSTQTRGGSRPPLLAALVAAGLGAATGAQAQNTLTYTTDTNGFFGVGGVINSVGLSGGGTGSTTQAINSVTFATFVLPTLGAGVEFSNADFSLIKTNQLNTNSGGALSVFGMPDFDANLVAAAAPAALVSASDNGVSDIGHTFSIGSDDAKTAGGASIPLTLPGGTVVLNGDGTPDSYHTTAYENTVASDPLLAGTTQLASGAAPVVPGLYPLKYQTIEADFFQPTGNGDNNYAYNGRVSTSTGATSYSSAVTDFLNAAYAQYGAGSTVTFALTPSIPPGATGYTTVKGELIDAGSGPSAYVVYSGTANPEELTYSTAVTPPAVPEAPSLPLAGLGLLALGLGGLRARKGRATAAAG